MTGISRENQTLFGVIENICEKHPHKQAIIYLGEKFSYSELREMVRRFAGALSELGVGVNDKVMIYIANCPQFLIAYLSPFLPYPQQRIREHSNGLPENGYLLRYPARSLSRRRAKSCSLLVATAPFVVATYRRVRLTPQDFGSLASRSF